MVCLFLSVFSKVVSVVMREDSILVDGLPAAWSVVLIVSSTLSGRLVEMAILC